MTKTKKKQHRVFGLGQEKNYLIENLAMLLDAGMGVIDALSSIQAEIRSKYMKKIIMQMRGAIESGSTIWMALKEVAIFPQHVISLIRVGEEAGRLAQNLKVVVEQQQKERIFKSKLRSAMMYPAFVMSITLVVGIGIAWFILPNLSKVFEQMKIELPAITKILIVFGVFLGDYGYFAVPAFLLALALLMYFIFAFPKTKFIGQAFLRRIPGIKKLIIEVELGRFGHLLGTLLDTGLPILQALESLIGVTNQAAYKKFYLHLRNAVEDGKSFHESFATYKGLHKLIPIPIQQMIVAGEQTGNLSASLQKIGLIFESRIDNTTKDLMTILEPILLVIIWLGVVGVALAVILPIYSLIGGF